MKTRVLVWTVAAAGVIAVTSGCRAPSGPSQSTAGPSLRATYLVVQTGTNKVVSHPSGFWDANAGGVYSSLTNAGYTFGGSVSDGDKGDVTVTSGVWVVDSGAVPLSEIGAGTSAELRGVLSDESGTGVAIFAGGDIGAATATTASGGDNDNSVATTAFVTGEIGTHAADTSSVHGIADTSVLVTTAGATFTGDITIPADPYDATGWNGSQEAATKDAVRDKFESLSPGGGGVSADSVTVTNLVSGPHGRWEVSGAQASLAPPSHVSASGTSATPDASITTEFHYTLTGNFTVAAISNVTTNHCRHGIEFVFLQGGSGGYQVTLATNFLPNDVFPAFTIVRTNIGYRTIARFKPRRDQVNVYDCVGWVEGCPP